MSDERTKQCREFLHGLATPMSIMKFAIKRIMTLEKCTQGMDQQREELFQKCLEALNKMDALHAEKKALISRWELEDKKNESNTG